MKIRCIITDDEPLAIEILENYVQRLDGWEIVGKCRSAIETFSILQNTEVDVIFLDISMPKLSGIDFVKSLKNLPPIIFTTAYREYAVESYELNALDYLVKPISFERFLKAVGKLALPFSSKPPPLLADSQTSEAQIALESTVQEANNDFLYLKADRKTYKIPFKNIFYIESVKEYIAVHTTQESIISYQAISHIEKDLPTDSFLRIHRSFIVAKDRITAFTAHSVHLGEKELPISRGYKEEVSKILKLR
jgi:DNA-binding LytR/AlgR family response regulator